MNYTFNPAKWYWVVAGSTTQVWFGGSAGYVPLSNTAYVNWLAAGHKPTKILNETELTVVLNRYGLVGPLSPAPPLDSEHTVDNFYIAKTGVSGGAPKKVFEIGTVEGVATIVARSAIIGDDTITAAKINVASLSELSPSAGTLTQGVLRSADSKFIIDLDNKRILVSD